MVDVGCIESAIDCRGGSRGGNLVIEVNRKRRGALVAL